jgi:TatD DNase family protein
MTTDFKKAEEIHKVAKEVPITQLLVETDAPYLTPVPFRGKRNEPGYARYVVEKIAELRDVPWQEVARQTTKNAHRLFSLEEST